MAEELMGDRQPWEIFDDSHYIAINHARWKTAMPIIESLRGLGVETCHDLGCGPGWFSERLLDMGLDVIGLEAREELVEEARRRVPSASFLQADLDQPLGDKAPAPADLSLCFGLLYHLENPFQAVRNVRQLTSRFSLIESQLIPSERPICQLVQESLNINQGFTNNALIPSRLALVKMLNTAGFSHIYEVMCPVEHEDFTETPERLKRRAMFVAAFEELPLPGLEWTESHAAPKFDYSRS